MNLLAIDPSVRGTGIAVFHDSQLKKVALWDMVLKTRTLMFGEIARRAANTQPGLPNSVFDLIVCEVPQIYKSSPGDPNDLIAVAMVAGALCATIPSMKIETYWPAEWKGQVPKAIHHKRLMAKLSPSELRVLDDARRSAGAGMHNILDAVGLGIWHSERKSQR